MITYPFGNGEFHRMNISLQFSTDWNIAARGVESKHEARDSKPFPMTKIRVFCMNATFSHIIKDNTKLE